MKNVTLILDDGSRFHGKSFGSVQYRHDRLSGESDRPFVCGAVDDTDVSAGGQLWCTSF